MHPTISTTAVFMATVLCYTTTAHADGTYYIKAFGGVSGLLGDSIVQNGNSVSLSYDTGATFGGAVGYDYAGTPWRSEVEFAYRSAEASDLPASVGTGGDFASTTLMVNGYYVFPSSTALAPYAGFGVGYITEIDFDIDTGAGEQEFNNRGGIAFQAMFGAEYSLSDRTALYGEARYFTAGSVDLDGAQGASLSADYDSFDINLGAVVKF